MRETRTKVIDGMTFRVQQLDGWRAQKLSVKVARMFGPALLQAGAGVGKSDFSNGAPKLGDMDIGALLGGLGAALEKLFAEVDEQKLEALSKEVLEGATVLQGSSEMPVLSVFGDLMAGRPLLGFKLLAFALETNLGDFGPGLAEIFRGLMSRPELKSEVLTTSSPNGRATG